MADIAIVAIIALGAFIGFRRGFILPAVATGGVLLAGSAVYAGPLTGALPAGNNLGLGAGVIAMGVAGTVLARVGGTAIALVHRFRFLQRVDRVLGMPLGAATAAIALYVALVATLVLDAWLDPLHGKAAIGAEELAAIATLARANPTLAVFADPVTLQALAETAVSAPLSIEQLDQVGAAVAFYEQTIRPELLQSRIAPLLLAAGEKLPVIGRPMSLPTQ